MSEFRRNVRRWMAATAVALLAAAVHAGDLVAVGTAYDSDGKRVLYREYYYLYPRDGRAEVIYRNDSDREIVEKVLHIGRTTVAPSFEQRDLRTGEVLAAQWRGDVVQLARRDHSDDDLRTRRVDPTGKMVIDAGFDNFIRQHFARLLDGDTLEFDFALPARLTTVVLQVRQRSCDDGDDRVCFRVSADNWMARLLSTPIDLEYDLDRRRLLTFRGVSNIAAADGSSQHVVIRYRYLRQQARSQGPVQASAYPW